MKAKTIDEVIFYLDKIVKEAKEDNCPVGYFAALYRKVTFRVKEGIINGEFENGERMERLDVIFANRYLEAYQLYTKGKSSSKSWEIAFCEANNYWTIVLQHILFGINAHINLDLGIAAAETAGENPIIELKNDFEKINHILSNLVGEVQEELSQIWPTLKKILLITGKIDDFMIDFSMKMSRDGAWEFANQFHKAKQEDWHHIISSRDQKVAELIHFIKPSSLIPKLVLRIIRIGERRTVRDRIGILE